MLTRKRIYDIVVDGFGTHYLVTRTGDEVMGEWIGLEAMLEKFLSAIDPNDYTIVVVDHRGEEVVMDLPEYMHEAVDDALQILEDLDSFRESKKQETNDEEED